VLTINSGAKMREWIWGVAETRYEFRCRAV